MKKVILTALFASMISVPAFAGNIKVVNGKGFKDGKVCYNGNCNTKVTVKEWIQAKKKK